MRKILALLVLGLFVGFGLSQEYKEYFQGYYALGDSLTAGYQDGGLVDYYQKVSFPALLAKNAGVENFALPLISPPGIPPVLQLFVSPKGQVYVAPISSTYGVPENLYYRGIYNNLGVPGASSYDMLGTVSDGGFHNIILRGMGTQLQLGIAAHPKLITLWIGNNDVLGAVLHGKVIEGATITPVKEFQNNLTTIIGALVNYTNAKIVVINLPRADLIPFTTYIKPYIEVQGQKVYLIGPKGPLTDEDRVLLTAQEYLSQGYGIPTQLGGNGQPLPDGVILDAHERAVIEARINKFNSIISSLASQFNLPLLDINKLMQKASTEGIMVGGVRLTSRYLTGGIFSLDGVHPSTLGYALIANEVIKVMNENFNWDVPLIDISQYLWSSPRTPSGSRAASLAVKNMVRALTVKK